MPVYHFIATVLLYAITADQLLTHTLSPQKVEFDFLEDARRLSVLSRVTLSLNHLEECGARPRLAHLA